MMLNYFYSGRVLHNNTTLSLQVATEHQFPISFKPYIFYTITLLLFKNFAIPTFRTVFSTGWLVSHLSLLLSRSRIRVCRRVCPKTWSIIVNKIIYFCRCHPHIASIKGLVLNSLNHMSPVFNIIPF